MENKALTVRLPTEQAEELEAVARVDGVPVSEEIRVAITELIEKRRGDKEFRDRVRASIERSKRVLERLSQT